MLSYYPSLLKVSAAAGILLLGAAVSAQPEANGPDPLASAKSAMRAARFEEAIVALDQSTDDDKTLVAEATYLKALAQFYLKQYKASIATADIQLAQHADSAWFRKARFLKARSLVALRKFEAAEAIYQEEALRLLSTKRKHEIAGVILSFADSLAQKPDPNDVGALPPDYGKAYKLYSKALEMEIGRELRDAVMYKRATAILLAGNHGQAIADFRAYLGEFDPEWTGVVGSVTRMSGRRRENPKPAGAHILESRYFLVQAQLQASQHAAARVNAEDLLVMVARATQEKPLASDLELQANAVWLLVRTYNMPTPAANELEKAVQVSQQFLQNHGDHPRAVQAAWQIPEAFRRQGRADRAIAEYQKFIAGEGFALPQGDAAIAKLEDHAKSPAELLDVWKKSALFRIGHIQSAQKNYAAAIETWSRYISQFPNGPNWSDCQRGIVDAEYQAAIAVMAEENYGQARQLLTAFLAKHPLDSRAAQILYLFGQIEYVAAKQLDSEPIKNMARVKAAYQKAIDRWQRVVSKYPNTEQSSLALYRVGVIYEEQLGQLELALETYRRLKWGPWAGHAQSRLATMTQKHLSVSTERKFRTNEQASVKINTRNIKKLTFKQYFLDLESYFRKTHEVGRVDGLDIDLIQPDKTWEVEIDGYVKYSPLEQQVEVPFAKGRAGVCIVNVSTDDFEATTLVVRSNLDLIVKSSRRELLVFVQDMLAEKPAKGVKLLVSNGEKVLATGMTGADGVFQGKFAELKDAKKARVFAMIDGSVASNLLDLSGLQFSNGLSAKGYLYTDRPAYQPGQTVKFRGIVRDVRDGSYVAPAGEQYEVAITDSAGRLLHEEPLTLSEFGTFHSEFQLDSGAPVGSYQLIARKPKGATYSSTFQVRQFKLEKLELTLETDRQVYFRGELLALTLKAAYYWGQPAADKLIRYRLPDGRELVEKTDAQGELLVKFDTTGMQPGAPLRFTASIEGENVSTSHSAMLAAQGFHIAVAPSRPLVLSGEPIEVEIETTAPDGAPIGKQATLFVLRRAVQKPNPVLSGVPWIKVAAQPAEEITVLQREVKTDPKTGIAKIQLADKALQAGGQYILRVSGQDRFEQVVTGQSRFHVSDDDDAMKLRLFAKSDTLEVGRKARVRLHSRVDAKLALVTFEGETILSHRVVPLKKGFNPIELDVDHQHFPNFRLSVSLMDGQQLRSAHKPFRVERQLNVTVKPLADAYAPGALGKVELTVTDQLGRPVTGELSLALVDEALFAHFPDATPNILQYFQQDAHRHAEFRESSTCGFRYEATTRSIIQALQDEKQRVVRERLEQEDLRRLSGRVDALRQQAATLNGRAMAADGAVPAPSVQLLISGDEMLGDSAPTAESAVVTGGVTLGTTRGGPGNGGFGGRDRSNWRMLERKSAAKGGAGRDLAPPRQELPEAGWWAGGIITGDDGKAIAEIPLPETTTKWRLTARGVTVGTLVGQSTANMMTRKEFFVTVKAPRQLQEGDAVRLIARVHNLTDYAGPVDLKLRVLGGDDLASQLAQRTLSTEIKSQGVVEVLFDSIKIPSASQLKFEVDAMAGDLSDALARTVPVRPWGLEFADQAGGIASSNTTARVKLPGGREYQTQWMSISVGPNLNRSVIDMAMGDSMSPVARGMGVGELRCICPPPPQWGRHAGSDLLAAVSALEYAQSAKAPREEIERLMRRARSLVSALVVSQRKDGGWSWRGTQATSDWGVSSLSFWALSESRRLGLAVHSDTYKKAQVYLQNQFTSLKQNDNDAKAVVLHALSTNRAADFAHANRLHRERNRLSAPALAYTALTLANLGRMDHAGEILDVLESQAKSANKRAYWDGSSNHPYLGEQVDTTAVATLALLRVRPTSPKLAQAIAWLLDRKGVWGFMPAKASGPAITALCQFYGNGKHAADDYTLKVLVNGKLFAEIASKEAKDTRLFSVPVDLLQRGENQVEFQIDGRGEFAYAVSMRGFSGELVDPKSWSYPYIHSRTYRHAPLEYRGRPIGASSSSPVKNIELGQRIKVHVDVGGHHQHKTYTVVEEHLPAGLLLVEGSLTGQFDHYIIQGERILLYYRPGRNVADFSYELIGYASGTYRVLPTVIRDSLNAGRMRLGTSAELVVLSPGEKSDDPYKMNDSERFALGKLTFDDGLYQQALPYLAHLFEHNRRYQEQEVARMLLWIYTSKQFYDAQQIVDVFEVLRERFPTLEIPYDKILTVGRAYRDIGEFERAYQVYRATIDASFINDSNVSAVLEDEGQFLGSIGYQENLWRDYPDTAEVATAFFAISQSLYQKAPKAHLLAKEQRQIALAQGRELPQKAPSKIAMLEETIRLLSEFLTLYPENPLADDAAFSMANALLDLKQYELVVEVCDAYKQRFQKSDLRSGFQYMMALGQFWQRQYDEALTAAKIVAQGKSKDRDFARYIIGQIHHAKNDPVSAIEWYRKVASLYADAQQAIDYFEEKHVVIDEVNVFKPGDSVEVTLKYRNVTEARCQVYRVDLMRLYLREKNLANVTKVNLAGIAPLVETTIKLGDGKDYVDKQRTIQLDLKEEGAYLVICRGDDLFASALTLVTPLEIEVQEDSQSGRVRANVINTQDKQYVPEVHVKAIGSADSQFRSGETDLRGVFVADRVRGKATVIAREGDSRYAFYRGTTWLGAPDQDRASQSAKPALKEGKLDFEENLKTRNSGIQRGNFLQYDQMRRAPNRGVEVQQAQ